MEWTERPNQRPPRSGCCRLTAGLSRGTGALGRLSCTWCRRGFCLCSQLCAITEGCCNITQSTFCTQIVKSSHLERNSAYYRMLFRHSLTIWYTVLNIAKLCLPFSYQGLRRQTIFSWPKLSVSCSRGALWDVHPKTDASPLCWVEFAKMSRRKYSICFCFHSSLKRVNNTSTVYEWLNTSLSEGYALNML